MASSSSSSESSLSLDIKNMRKEYDLKFLYQFLGHEIEFKTQSNEHLFGTLSAYNTNGTYTFKNLRKSNGAFWSVKQVYTLRDFSGKFITTPKSTEPSKPLKPSKQEIAEEDLDLIFNDETIELVKVDDTDATEIILDLSQIDSFQNPDIKDLIYENCEFTFDLNQDEFETKISNEVVRITSSKDPLLPKAVDTLSKQTLISLTVLPFSNDNREAPIDFVIIGCCDGTFILSARFVVRLRKILESNDICKVMHDSCISLARLFFLFKVDVQNVDDTMVIDHLSTQKYVKNRKLLCGIKSFIRCLDVYLAIELPWGKMENFYERCGKGKLTAAKMDETGQGYARSMVMLLPQLRLEMLKLYSFPLVKSTFAYSQIIKTASPELFNDLKFFNLINPHYLMNVKEGINEDEISGSSTAEISNLLSQKFKYFNRSKKVMTCDSCTQTEPISLNIEQPATTIKPTPTQPPPQKLIKRPLLKGPARRLLDRNRTKTVSAPISPIKSQSEHNSQSQNCDSQLHGHVNGENCISNGYEISNNTDEKMIDWESVKVPELEDDGWVVPKIKIYPAGSNYNQLISDNP